MSGDIGVFASAVVRLRNTIVLGDTKKCIIFGNSGMGLSSKSDTFLAANALKEYRGVQQVFSVSYAVV